MKSTTPRRKTMTKAEAQGFVDGTERVSRLLSDPERARRVAEIREDGREMDRVYAMNLAMVRKAAEMTQAEIAQKLGVGQGDVSKIEHRSDLLLSTLVGYLTAAGAEHPRLIVEVHGRHVEMDLSAFAADKR